MQGRTPVATLLAIVLLIIISEFFVIEIRFDFSLIAMIVYAAIIGSLTTIADSFVSAKAKNHESVFEIRLKIYDLFKENESHILDIQKAIEMSVQKECITELKEPILFDFRSFPNNDLLIQEIKSGAMKRRIKASRLSWREKQYFYKLIKDFNGPFEIRRIRIDYETRDLIKQDNKSVWGIASTAFSLILSIVGLVGWGVFSGLAIESAIVGAMSLGLYLIKNIESYIHLRKDYLRYYRHHLSKIENAIALTGE